MTSVPKTIDHGRRLLPIVLDEIATQDPKRVYAVISHSSDPKDGFKDVLETFEVLAYIGPSDLRYHSFILGANKIGFQLLLLSPRNSLEGDLNLFKTTNTEAILTTEGYPLPQDVADQSGLPVETIPSLEFFLSPGKVKNYTFDKTFEEANSDPFLILHTSRSTGLPKAVFCKHGWAASMDAMEDLLELDGHVPFFSSLADKRIYAMLPPFHAGGVILFLLNTIWRNSCCIWGPPSRPPNADLIESILRSVHADMFLGAPSIIEEMMQQPSPRLALENVKRIGYGGGPMTREIGTLLGRNSDINNMMGSTELCAFPTYSYWIDPEDWEYILHNPIHEGFEFRPVSEGLYELFVVRHPSTDQYHAIWSTFPDLNVYSMNDLYAKHPSKSNLWLHFGRADDVIVLSNGEKHNPLSMESIPRKCVGVKDALVVGEGRFSIGAILELTDELTAKLGTSEEKAGFIEVEIWKFAEEANKTAPAHDQLALDKIILASSRKPFPGAGKGTVQKAAAIKLYSVEIDELYQRDEQQDIVAPDTHKIDIRQHEDGLETEIWASVQNMIKTPVTDLDQDFFSTGMDLLQVMTLVKKLKGVVEGIPADSITTRLVYTNPTVQKLSSALRALYIHQSSESTSSPRSTPTLTLEETLEKYIQQLPPSSFQDDSASRNDKLVVLLTGITGSLGSYLLHTLIESSSVSKIYCLNRRTDAVTYQAKRNAESGLVSVWGEKVCFVHADLNKNNMGIEIDSFIELKNEVNVIIHNQWQVDFNLSLSSFEPFISGALNLIKFSASSTLSPSIFFTSSIGAVGNWSALHGSQLVPEIAISDSSTPLLQGYSQSKWITERLLDAARQKSGVNSAALRVGQIAGPVEVGIKGVWNKQEWLPSIIASSKHMGFIPALLPLQNDIPWIPVDLMAEIIVDLVEQNSQPRIPGGEPWTKYYHLVNPSSGKWKDLVPVIQQHFLPVNIKVIPFDDWIGKLLESHDDMGLDIATNPALKLITFYQSILPGNGLHEVKLDTSNTQLASSKMRNIGGVVLSRMSMWLRQWDF